MNEFESPEILKAARQLMGECVVDDFGVGKESWCAPRRCVSSSLPILSVI